MQWRHKYDDLLASVPLAIWYLLAVRNQWPLWHIQFNGPFTFLSSLRIISEISFICYALLLVIILPFRIPTIGKACGLLPRVDAFLGTLFSVGLIWLRPVELSVSMQLVVAILLVCGNVLTIAVLFYLGRSFSVMPEARQLVTTGPYTFIRHPLYASEMFYIIGGMLQFAQPWAAVIVTVQCWFQLRRMKNEERVLRLAFPAYGSYALRTPRLIPRIFRWS